MTDLIKPDALPTTERAAPVDPGEPARGKWYWMTAKDDDGKASRKLYCATHVGSNYVQMTRPTVRGTAERRVHFDDFDDTCEFEPNAEVHIKAKIAEHWDNAQALIREVQALTAKLGVAPRAQLGDGAAAETQALAIRSGEPIKQYKNALIKAKDKTLPELFEKIKTENEASAMWMQAQLLPMQAEAEDLESAVDRIKDRVFSVELYAGLIEEVERIRDGATAADDEPVHIMQRRHYMDEECLVGYEHGGMEFKDLKAFEKWLCKPKNCDRILPFPRTIVAFRVRREMKDRDPDGDTPMLLHLINVMNLEKYDKLTFLYFRNGGQVFRLKTGIEFDAKLFPDRTKRVMAEGALWGKRSFGDVEEVLTDDQYKAALADARAKVSTAPDDFDWDLHRLENDWKPYDKKSVYYDDIKAYIEKLAKEHNRLVLVVQGLLDRSPVFHPHPPWQLWTAAGFETGVRLHFDDDRALSAGEKPDFETYRAKLNASLAVGSVTIGQELVWEKREAVKANRRERYRDSYVRRYRPPGDPGPGVVAKVAKYAASSGRVTYLWERDVRVRGWRQHDPARQVPASLTTGEEHVLNVDAYTPGDFHIFFDDPRTRQEYLKWAPLLLEAEECHAGNRELKPGPRRKARRKPRSREERPAFELPKARKPPPPVGAQYRDVNVKLLYAAETRGGEKFVKGEVLRVSSYYRRKLSLYDPKRKNHRISDVSIRDVVIVGKP